jgi:O-antigen/teichoic acid export membrane protein
MRLRLIYSPFNWVVSFYNRFLAPWIHPADEARDYLFMHSLMLFVGAQFGNLCNLLFQVIMARMLGNVDYGVLFAILSALMMLGLPLGALGGAVTHFTSMSMAREERDQIKAMMRSLARDFLMPTLLMVILAVFWRHDMARVFKLESTVPVYLAVTTVVVMLLAAVPGGVLAGMQAFEWAALIGNGWTLLRLLLGVILVWLGLGANGGLIANVFGLLVSAVLSLVICVSLLGRGRVSASRPVGLYSYMGGYMATFAAYGLLASTDVLWVKYYFPPDQAGVFAKATMVARMALFLPGPVCAAMFPKVTSAGESTQANYRTLMKAMVLTGLIGGGIGLVCLALPDLMLRLLVREVQTGQVAVLRAMVLALAPLTLVMVLMYFELAQRRFRIMIPLYVCAVGYVVGVMRWHETPLQIVTVLGSMSVLSLLLSLLVMPWRKMKQEECISKG